MDDIADIDELIRHGMGDTGRLYHIKSRMQNGKPMYESDKKYLQRTIREYRRRVEHQGQEPITAPKVQAERPRAKDRVQSVRRASAAWYLMPVFLGIMGGIIAYYMVKDDDPGRARGCMIVGSVITAIFMTLILASGLRTGGTALLFLSLFAIIAALLMRHAVNSSARKKAQTRALVHFGAEDMDYMDGVQFEKLLAAVFSTLGYAVETTPATGDYGADLILTKDGKRIAVQAKRQFRNVGNKAVQEAIGGASYYRTGDAWVVTNAGFTTGAVRQAAGAGVLLVDRAKLMKYMVRAKELIESEGR